MAASIYGEFAADPNLSLWQGGEQAASADMTGVQPGVGDAPYSRDSGMFKATASPTEGVDRVDIYSGFGGPDLQRGF
jgi:hypothetical protein